MGNHEYCVDCGETDHHYGRPCDPEAKRKHQNRNNQCQCGSELTNSRRCGKCGGRQRLKKKDVKDVRTRIEWIQQEANKEIKTLSEIYERALKEIEEKRDERISKIRSSCQHVWGGFGEVYSCDKCDLTTFN